MSEWISVKDRMPEVGKIVLMYHPDYFSFSEERISLGYFYRMEWLTEEYSERNVTHWMPLPEPPKEM